MGGTPLFQETVLRFLELEEIKDSLFYCPETDSFYRSEKGVMISQDGKELYKSILNHFIEYDATKNVNVERIKQAIELMKVIGMKEIKTLKTDYIAFKDCLYDLGKLEFTDFSDDKKAFIRFPYTREEVENTPTPVFAEYLRTTFVKEDTGETDLELIKYLKKMMGYIITPSASGTCFFFVGSGANGKSVLADLLVDMVGPEYTSALSLESLTTSRFSLSTLSGKLLNVCNEEESKYLRSDAFKALVTGELMMAERKFERPFLMRPISKFVFCTNEMPTFEGVNKGLMRRISIIPFKRYFAPDKRDRLLPSKLRKEMAGIIGIALNGAVEWAETNDFELAPESVIAQKLDFEFTSSTALNFLKNNYEESLDENNFVLAQTLYDLYREWCENNGKKPINNIAFGKIISEIYNTKSSIKWIEGKTKRIWFLKSKEEPDPSKPVDF